MTGPLRKWEHAVVVGIVYGVAPLIVISILISFALGVLQWR